MDESQQLTRELQDHPHRVKYLVKAKSKRDEINRLALFCLLGSLYDMEVRAKQHGDGTTEPNYYLRYQLGHGTKDRQHKLAGRCSARRC